MMDTSRILQKGPEYLRKQMERERETPGRSAAERLAATKPEYMRNQQSPASETGSSMGSSDQSEVPSSSPTNAVDESSPHEVNMVKRNSSKKRPDSLLLYRQKGELQKGSSDGNGRKPIKRTLLLSRRHKTDPLPHQEFEEYECDASSGQRLANETNDSEQDCQDVTRKLTTMTVNIRDNVAKKTTAVPTEQEYDVRKPTTMVTNNQEDVAQKLTSVVTNNKEDFARKPTTVVTINREDVARKPTTVVTINRENVAWKPTTVITNNGKDVGRKPTTVVTNNQEDIARKPTTVVMSNRENVTGKPTTAAATNREDTERKLTTVVTKICENVARKPKTAIVNDLQDVTSGSEHRRNRVSRSHSDISSRYSRSFADFDTFFTYCGLDDDVIESVGRDNFCAYSEAPDEVFIGSGKVRSVSMATSDDGFSQTGSNRSDGLQEDELPDKRSGHGTSVIERNARIIKWLYSCRNAAQSGKMLRDLE